MVAAPRGVGSVECDGDDGVLLAEAMARAEGEQRQMDAEKSEEVQEGVQVGSLAGVAAPVPEALEAKVDDDGKVVGDDDAALEEARLAREVDGGRCIFWRAARV